MAGPGTARSGEAVIRILTLVLAAGVPWCATTAPAVAQDSLLQRPLIRGLSFRGNHGLDDYTLGVSIATTNSSWWVRTPLVSWLGLGQRRYFDEREFRRDVLRLKLLYSQVGYPDAAIDTVVTRRPSSVSLAVRITEGAPVRIVDLTVAGTEAVVSPDRLERQIPLEEGAPFNRLLLGASTDTIRAALQDRGYPFAEVFRGFSVDRAAHTATVSFDVDPGPKARYGEVTIAGARRVREGAIRRMLPIREGRDYRRRDLVAAQRDLYATGAFDYVDVGLVDSVAGGPTDSAVSVRVLVREGRFHRLRAAPGYGTEDCLRMLTGFSAARVLRGLRTLDVTARFSKIGTGDPLTWGLQNSVCPALSDESDPDRLALNYHVSASLTEPALFGRTVGGAVALVAERRSELDAYVRQGVGGEVSLTLRTPWQMPLTLSYELSRATTKASPATTCFFLNVCREADIAAYQEPRRSTVLGLVALRNRRNSVLDPSRGTFTSAEIQWGSALLGSDSLSIFAKLQGQFSSSHRLGDRTVLAWRVGAGTLVYGPTINVSGAEQQYVPPERRFYSGGANSVRGYGQNELGPVVRVIEFEPLDTDGDGTADSVRADTLTSAAGGSDLVLANVELRTALPGFGGRVQLALFVDAGQVYDRRDDAADPGPRITPGIGVRFVTGVGPIRFDVGYNGYAARAGPLYREEGSQLVIDNPTQPIYAPPRSGKFLDRLRLHFSVGQAF